jgi:hypothetical protein
MQKYSLCIIDDKIPVEQFLGKIEVNDAGIIDKNILANYLKWAEETIWPDTNLCDLIKCLMDQTELISDISGFTSHSFYFNHIEESLYSPDIVIFDWDIGTSDATSEESLKKLLEKTYCLVAIYTGCDKQVEINMIIQRKEFKLFNSRVFVIEKDEENSAEKVIDELKKHLDDFSFSYGRDFKHNINAAINTSFSTIGGLSFDQFIKVFGELDNNDKKYKISSLDFIDTMSDQIKAHLISSRTIEPLIALETSDDILVEKQLWHFRMFHEPQDDVVRKGDIVWNKKNEKYYLIISSDCHLNDFWKKNLGLITAISLYKANDPSITEKLKKYLKLKTLKEFRLSSLVNPQGINGITIFPFMDKNDDYIVMLKEVESFEIDNTPKDNKGTHLLKYGEMIDFVGKNRFRLNEPFLSALIEKILRSITDIGVPDYSDKIRDGLEKHITKLGIGETD